MSTHDPMGETPFVRPAFSFDRELVTVRVAWLCDRRIVGFPLSVLLYLNHELVDPMRGLTPRDVGEALGRSRDTVVNAIAALEAAGYLRITRRDGVIERYDVVDPWGADL